MKYIRTRIRQEQRGIASTPRASINGKSHPQKISEKGLLKEIYMCEIYIRARQEQRDIALKGYCFDALHLHKWEKSPFKEIGKVTLKRDLYMWEIYQDIDTAGAKSHCFDTLRLRKWIKLTFSSVRFAWLKLAGLSPSKCHARMPRKKKIVPGAPQKSKFGLPN